MQIQVLNVGSGDSSVVRAPDSWWKGRGFESLQERRDSFLLQGQLSMLTLYFGIRSTRTSVLPQQHVKDPDHSAKSAGGGLQLSHACTLRMWLCMKWHGAWLYGVHRTHRDGSSFTWHQPCQRCKYTISVESKTRYKKLVTRVKSYASAVSLLERGEQRYVNAINKCYQVKLSNTWALPPLCPTIRTWVSKHGA